MYTYLLIAWVGPDGYWAVFFHHGGFSKKLMDKQMGKYVNGLKQLETQMIVWPPLKEILELSECWM